MKSTYTLALLATVTLLVAQSGRADDNLANDQTNQVNEPYAMAHTNANNMAEANNTAETNNMAEANNTTEPLFRANELSLDAFGTVAVGQSTLNHLTGNRVRKDGSLGLGAGINYFITRYVGMGADAYSESPQHSFVDNASGSLIFRVPIEPLHLAPYIYGGAGYQFDTADRYFGQVGGGLEVRITKHVGLFTDARYIFFKDIPDFGMGRAGVRLSF